MLNIIFFVLFILIWVMAVGFIVYAYFYHEQQRKVLRYIAFKLSSLTKQEASDSAPVMPKKSGVEPIKQTPHKTETKLTIDKNEPISKYEGMTLPDEVDITFK